MTNNFETETVMSLKKKFYGAWNEPVVPAVSEPSGAPGAPNRFATWSLCGNACDVVPLEQTQRCVPLAARLCTMSGTVLTIACQTGRRTRRRSCFYAMLFMSTNVLLV